MKQANEKKDKIKICVKCQEEKPVSEFHRRGDSYKSYCKICRSLEYFSNKEAEQQKRKEHYLNNKDAYIQRSKQWRLANPEKKKAWNKVWANNHKDYYAMYASFRRDGIEQATPGWLTEEDMFLFEEIYHLAKIRREVTGLEWHVDHIIPLKGRLVCGLHTPDNLQVILGNLNRKKSNAWQV